MNRKKSTKKKAATRKRPPIAVDEFDREMVISTFSDLQPAQRLEWERARAKPGRPRRGSGATVISVSVERSLLDRADLTARRLGITRSELIARGLRAALAATGTG